jgi:hypothetical protein
MNPPCEACPFRRDVAPYLTPERGMALAFSTRLLGHDFFCHETVDYGARTTKARMKNAQLCRGFAIMRAQEGRGRKHRFVEDRDLVYRSMGEMIVAYLERNR